MLSRNGTKPNGSGGGQTPWMGVRGRPKKRKGGGGKGRGGGAEG